MDLDGVLHDHKNPIEGKRMGLPIEGAKEALSLYKRDGHTILIHTAKAQTEAGRCAVIDWLHHYEIPFDDVLGKPNADYYIDDRAIHFTSWKEITI